MRDELLKQTVDNVVKYLPDNSFIYVADQGLETTVKSTYFKNLFSQTGRVFYFTLPYDCGLSYARNFLVEKAKLTGMDFCFISADSLQFSSKPDFTDIISGMVEEKNALVGFDIEKRIPWEWNIELRPNDCFWLSKVKEEDIITHGDIVIKKVQMCRNFFIAKTEALYNIKWDNELKLAEHEDFFYRFKQGGYKCIWTNLIKGRYIEYKPEDYLKMRDRMYHTFQYIMLKKYNITQWMKYEE